MKKSNQKNHDYGSVVSKLFKKALVKELAKLRQPLLALYFNGFLVAPPHYVGFNFIFHIKLRTYFKINGFRDWPLAR